MNIIVFFFERFYCHDFKELMKKLAHIFTQGLFNINFSCQISRSLFVYKDLISAFYDPWELKLAACETSWLLDKTTDVTVS